MPMHDWTRVKAGTYHNFHVLWMSKIMDRLNAGLLPSGYFAMAEPMIGRPEPDVVIGQTLPPDQVRYARKTNRVAIHHGLGEVVAVIELVSPGNKDRQHSLRTFVQKATDLFNQRVNLLIIDPFPPGPHDPQGIPAAILKAFTDAPFELPPDKPLTLASYQVEPILTSYVEPIAVGDPLPDMPLLLEDEFSINVPLEETYQTTWNVLPAEIRQLLEPQIQP
jgi:hypothetical protein